MRFDLSLILGGLFSYAGWWLSTRGASLFCRLEVKATTDEVSALFQVRRRAKKARSKRKGKNKSS